MKTIAPQEVTESFKAFSSEKLTKTNTKKLQKMTVINIHMYAVIGFLLFSIMINLNLWIGFYLEKTACSEAAF